MQTILQTTPTRTIHKPPKGPQLGVMGRPKVYGDDHPCWQAMLEGMTSGQALGTLLAMPGMPTYPIVYERLERDPAYLARHNKALQNRADKLADEILTLSDAEMPPGLDGPGRSAWVQQQRLRVDARKWIAAKLQPKRYGERVDVTVQDERVSVLQALEQAQARVSIGLAAPVIEDVQAK